MKIFLSQNFYVFFQNKLLINIITVIVNFSAEPKMRIENSHFQKIRGKSFSHQIPIQTHSILETYQLSFFLLSNYFHYLFFYSRA